MTCGGKLCVMSSSSIVVSGMELAIIVCELAVGRSDAGGGSFSDVVVDVVQCAVSLVGNVPMVTGGLVSVVDTTVKLCEAWVN